MFTLLTLLPLTILTYASISLGSDAVTREVRAEVQSSATLEARAVVIRMSGVAAQAGGFAKSSALLTAFGGSNGRNRDVPALQDETEQILQSNPGFSSAAVLDTAGRLISIAPPSPSIIGRSFSYRDWYQVVRRTGATYVSSALRSAAAGHPLVVAVATPIRVPGSPAGSAPVIGYLSLGYQLTAIQQFVTSFEQGQAVALTVTDQRGVILATPRPGSGLVSGAQDPRVRRALAGQSGIVSIDTHSGRVLSAYTPVGDLGWTVHADVSEATAFAGASRLRLTVLAVAGALSLVLFVAAWLLGRLWRERSAAEAAIRALNVDLEARVTERTADLQQANQNLEAFSYSISHDLRAPLRALSGFSEALVEEYGDRLDATGRDYAARIQSASERMGNLIEDLLHMSRVSRAEMRLEPVNLSLEVAATAKDLQRRESDRCASFAIQGDVWVTADRALIRTVVENLLGNAWKFTSRCPEAHIEFGATTGDGGEVCCYVRDNGTGFDPAYVDKLFRPFERLHSAADFPGTGIGLASVRRIVERHGGRTWAQGAVDGGATFYFTIGTESTTTCATTGPASTPPTPASRSSRSSGSTTPASSPAPASAWPASGGSSNATADGPGPRAPSTAAPPSTSPSTRRRHHDAAWPLLP